MAKIDLKFAELQSPLFLAGTNHGLKLMIDKRPIRLIYDRSEKELLVYFNGEMAIVPYPNVASMTPLNIDDIGKVEVKVQAVPKNPAPQGKIKAQVSDPTAHVFANGSGKVRD